MASVNPTSSYYQQLVNKNKGIGGLSSGLDTNAIMEALTASYRSKIAKQMQQKQLTQWKQTAYRTAVTALDAFKNKWLSKTNTDSSTSIWSGNFFSTFKAATTSNKVNVTTTANSQIGDIKITEVKQLASAHSIISRDLNNGNLSGTVDINSLFEANGSLKAGVSFSGQILSLNVDGALKNIKLDTLNSTNRTNFINDLQALINAPGAIGTKNNVYDSAGRLISGDPIVVADLDAAGHLTFSHDTGKVSMSVSNTMLGLNQGDSNRIDPSKATLGSLVGMPSVGDSYSFVINGTEITAKATDTLATLVSRINSSTAGVRVNYSNITGKLEMTSKTTGQSGYIDMYDVRGGLTSSLFGAKGATGVTSGQLFKTGDFTGSVPTSILDKYNAAKAQMVADQAIDPDDNSAMAKFLADLGNYQISLTIGDTNGNSKTATVKPVLDGALKTKMLNGDPITDEELLNGLANGFNAGIQKAFTGETAVKFTSDAAGNFTLNVPDNRKVEMKPADSNALTNGLALLGFTQNNYTNAVDFDNYGSIGIGGISATFINTYTAGDPIRLDLSINGNNYAVSFSLSQDEKDKLSNYLDTAHSDYSLKNAADLITGKLNKAITDVASLNDIAYIKNSATSYTMLVGFEADKNGKISLATDKGLDVTVTSAFDLLGVAAGASNINKTRTDSAVFTVGDLGITDGYININGKNITVNTSDSMQTFLDRINAAVGEGTVKIAGGKLVIEGGYSLSISAVPSGTSIDPGDGSAVTVGSTTNILSKLFGLSSNSYTTQNAGYNEIGRAQDAEIVALVGGQSKTLNSSTNTFDFNGTRVEVLEETKETINISVASDPDKLIDKLKAFIEDYNALVATLTGMVREKGNPDYPPLTDEQKAEMTTAEIEKWEVEAKKGLLRYDPTLTGILNSLRGTLYKTVGENISLYGIGITTVSILENGAAKDGQIEIRPENLERLRNAIINDPESVKRLFTDAENGISKMLGDVIDKATYVSSLPEKRGSLITIAGTETLIGDNTSSLSKKIDAYDEAITRLKTQLESQYNRYWKQFSALELAIQKMSSQSSWLSQFSGG